ncbi:MAG: hypothetical protein HYZ91_03910 [Candidatus Omnitrophica bacterium]|nr:hypothetical protein [Candidatus Omnitrophota bacterium]
MGKRMGRVCGFAVAAGVVGMVAAFPSIGEAAGMGGAKVTLSLTKNYTASPWTNEVGWSNRAIGKLSFGLKNALLGWTDLFVEPREASQAGGTVLTGIGIGVKDALENTLGGAVHVLTFPLTELDAPLPEGGTQLLNS